MVSGQWANLARMPGVTPLLFIEGHPGIFNDHRESGPRFNVSSEGRDSRLLFERGTIQGGFSTATETISSSP